MTDMDKSQDPHATTELPALTSPPMSWRRCRTGQRCYVKVMLSDVAWLPCTRRLWWHRSHRNGYRYTYYSSRLQGTEQPKYTKGAIKWR